LSVSVHYPRGRGAKPFGRTQHLQAFLLRKPKGVKTMLKKLNDGLMVEKKIKVMREELSFEEKGGQQ
jgi:hypothetical protein